jgi:hypothetical protein
MRKALACLIGLLVLVGLACEQAGEILSSEDATARAREGIFQPSADGSSATGANFEPGDLATVTGTGFLINLLNAPGGRISGSQSQGSEVEILESAEFEGIIWYHVDSETGQGWLKAENLEPIAGEPEGEGEVEISGPQAGDTVYLVSTGFLVNLLAEPGGRVQAVQERGVQVTIIQVFQTAEGEIWYQIDAPTGEGWVSAENISEVAP